MTRLILDEDVKPLSEFRANVASCISQVRKTKRPVVITHHGKSAAVLLGVSEYEALMQKMEVLEDIHVAEKQFSQGRGISHELALNLIYSSTLRLSSRPFGCAQAKLEPGSSVNATRLDSSFRWNDR